MVYIQRGNAWKWKITLMSVWHARLYAAFVLYGLKPAKPRDLKPVSKPHFPQKKQLFVRSPLKHGPGSIKVCCGGLTDDWDFLSQLRLWHRIWFGWPTPTSFRHLLHPCILLTGLKNIHTVLKIQMKDMGICPTTGWCKDTAPTTPSPLFPREPGFGVYGISCPRGKNKCRNSHCCVS